MKKFYDIIDFDSFGFEYYFYRHFNFFSQEIEETHHEERLINSPELGELCNELNFIVK